MERYAVDFGTSNTVVARWNFAREEPQTMSFPAITAPGSGAMPPVTPSVLYYRGEESFLMGYEVTSRGLDDIRSSRYFGASSGVFCTSPPSTRTAAGSFPPTISRGCISPGCWAIWS